MALKWTEDKILEIADLRKSGMTLNQACEKLGGTQAGYYNFLRSRRDLADQVKTRGASRTGPKPRSEAKMVTLEIPEPKEDTMIILIGNSSHIVKALEKVKH